MLNNNRRIDILINFYLGQIFANFSSLDIEALVHRHFKFLVNGLNSGFDIEYLSVNITFEITHLVDNLIVCTLDYI